MTIPTLRELLTHNDWAMDRLLASARPLSNAQLDQQFEMGSGTLRETLKHLYGAERIWYERVGVPGSASLIQAAAINDMAGLFDAVGTMRTARTKWQSTLTESDMQKAIHYTNLKGQSFINAFGDILLHVCNHGVHHRAQASNMLRHVTGQVPKTGLDYIFMRISSNDAPPSELDIATLHRYFEYGDWANARAIAASERLTDELLDRPFEMGTGSLRNTLEHLAYAEEWWLEYWLERGRPHFNDTPASLPVGEIHRRMRAVADARFRFMDKASPDALRRRMTIEPRPGRHFEFSPGESMLQLCGHGTHHRAQMLNMLRRLGAAPPTLDLIQWVRETRGE